MSLHIQHIKPVFCLVTAFILSCVSGPLLRASDSTAVRLVGAGAGIHFPTATYKQYMRRASPSLAINYLTSFRHPDFYVGGQFGMDIHDHMERNYRRIDSRGISYDSEEKVDVTSADLIGECRYMPYVASWIQPFVGLRAGLRVTLSSLTETNPNSNYEGSNRLYSNIHNAWVMQYGAAGGFIVPVGNVFVEVQGNYMEAQPGRHLIRRADWKRVSHSGPLDLFREVRALQQFWGVHVKVLFPL